MSLLTAVRDIDRLRQITTVLARHGFGALVARLGLAAPSPSEASSEEPMVARPLLGERIRLVLQDLGPTFVKLGQIASTRSDLLPADILVELKKLQDDVAPFPEAEARQMIEESLGAPVDQVFAEFEGKPLASASVAQVHRALLRVLPDEAPVQVAVKVQRPGIEALVARDLNLLYMLASLVERAIPESRIYRPTGLVQEFDRAITAELDFMLEAQNARRFAENFHDEPALRIPQVYGQASGKRVLTLEYLDGVKVTLAVKQGADGRWIAENAVRIILKMVFEDGFFHADPHPGNILILPRPESGQYEPGQPVIIGMLDLGLVGRLSPRLRDLSVDLLMGAARNDPEAMADALMAIGKPHKKLDVEAFRAYVRDMADRHLGRELKHMEAAAIMRDFIVGAMRFDIEIPTELTMMLRAMMTIEGVGKEIDPELDLFKVARPYLGRIIWQRYHPLRLGNELLHNAGRLSAMARDMPVQVQEILDDLRHGRLRLRSQDPDHTRALDHFGRRVRATLCSVALLLGGVGLLMSGRFINLGYGLLVGAGVFFVLHILVDFRESRHRSDEP